MKKIIPLFLIAMSLCGCTGQMIEPVPQITSFKSFRLSITTDAAGEDIYEAICEEDHTTLQHYHLLQFWDSSLDDYAEQRFDEVSVEGGEELTKQILDLLNEYDISSWDGFYESDDNVCDGGGFSFSLILGDQTEISAGGSNAYPKGYTGFKNSLYELIKK